MKPYSMDLRTRVLADSDAGMDSKVVSEKFSVSRSWVDFLKQRRRETGEIAPRKAVRTKPSKLSENMEKLRELVEEKPDRTLEELRRELGVSCSLTSVWRALSRLGLTLKKSHPRQ